MKIIMNIEFNFSHINNKYNIYPATSQKHHPADISSGGGRRRAPGGLCGSRLSTCSGHSLKLIP